MKKTDMAGVKKVKCDRKELRQRVLAVAARAFAVHGIRNVRMDDIAGSLSISKRTLYELFTDKKQLLLEIMLEHHREMHLYIAEVASRAENALEVIFAFYTRKSRELCELNPSFFRDLRKYPKVLECIREKQKANDAEALAHFKQGVKQGIFRDDINFDIINQAMSMQLDLLIYSDITEDYPLADIYREITFLHMRGITTEKGMQMVNAFLQSVVEKQE